MNYKPPAFWRNRIPKTYLTSKISCVHFREFFCWVFWVTIPCQLTLIHTKVSTESIQTCLGMLHNMQSFEPILPGLWPSGFTWLEPGLLRDLKTTLSCGHLTS